MNSKDSQLPAPTPALSDALHALRRATEKLEHFDASRHDWELMLSLLLVIDRRCSRHLNTVWQSFSDSLKDGRKLSVGSRYCTQLAKAYLQLFRIVDEEPNAAELNLPQFLVHAMKALVDHARWQYLQYRTPETPTWQAMAHIYHSVERQRSMQKEEIEEFESCAAQVQSEYVQAILLKTVPTFGMREEEIQLWINIIRKSALKELGLQPLPDAGENVRIDLGSGETLVQNQATPPAALLRYLPLENVRKILADHLGSDGFERRATIGLVKRLLTGRWVTDTANRCESRKALIRTGEIAIGHLRITTILRSLSPALANSGSHFMRCAIANVSQGGCRISLPHRSDSPLRVNSLVCLVLGHNGPMKIGITQWVKRSSGDTDEAGIRLLEGAPTVTPLASNKPWPGGLLVENAIVLCHGNYHSCEEILVLLKPGCYSTELQCRVKLSRLRLEPIAILATGEDYELASFRVTIPERNIVRQSPADLESER